MFENYNRRNSCFFFQKVAKDLPHITNKEEYNSLITKNQAKTATNAHRDTPANLAMNQNNNNQTCC